MKKNILIKGIAALMMASAVSPALTSCSSDYLEKAPITSTSAADIGGTIEGARAAKTGLCQGMYRQFTGHNLFSTNGEPWMMIYYGEVFGNTFLSNYFCGHGTGNGYTTWTQLRDETYWGAQQMWYYAYNLISWANTMLDNIDNLEPYEGERDFIKAVALTMRAHCYIRLVQCYAPNWENANGGDVKCLIIRNT
ncbi:MAG: RagB/SusD family nutrient uptake outer membrane protein, partial [Muribaculaceae bacterium]|nr:RagB/SusD family nutrient uptake outer membrane protein [Muribaculaceae bacterium]